VTGLLRLEAAGVVRARWLAAALAVAGGTVAFFWALASRESAILAFTGYTRVVTGTGLAALLGLPLLALFGTTQAATWARSQGVLEWYLSYPVSRGALFRALLVPRLAAVAGPAVLAVILLAAMAAVSGQPIAFGLLSTMLALLLGQAFCFAAIGLWISIASRSAEQALLRGLLVWLTCVALLDFALVGAMLQWNLPPRTVFLLSAINPVQAGRLGFLGGTDPDLGVLGPVGTWVATTLGPSGTLAYGIAWPVVVGGLALAAGWRAFRKGDLL
jgi:ABC-type transport system involved in multi-copper enzyme maturation permease subunit